MIKIEIDYMTQFGRFRDALYLPDDHGFSEAEIQAMKEQRRDNWVALIQKAMEESAEESPEEPQF